MYQTIRQPGAQVGAANLLPSGLQIGTGVRTVATERIHTQGNVKETGNPLDIAIQGNGFLQVEMPDGTFAYTRDGTLQKDQNGHLVTAGGYPIPPPIHVPDNALTITIPRAAHVSVTPPAAAGATVQTAHL